MNAIAIIMALLPAVTSAPAPGAALPASAPSKLWATDFAAFASAHPRGRWIVAHSATPAISAEEAEASARTSAVEILGPQVRARLSDRINTNDLRPYIDAALRSDGWIADRLVQADERPYGTIWRQSILVDASSERLDELASGINSTSRRERARRGAIIGSGVVLSIAAALGFVILNWLTRGYLRTRLAVASIGIVLLGVVLIAGLTSF